MLITDTIHPEMTLEEVIEKIEEIRLELVQLGMDKGFQDQTVLSVSHQLDILLNLYYLISRDDSGH